MWDIWKFRNKILFDNWNINDPWIHKKVLLSIKEHPCKEEEDKLEVLLNPIYFNNIPIGFFDCATADNKCGIGLYLKISSSHTIKAQFAGGTGNNMKGELLGLWGILLLATLHSIKKLMVACDSKVNGH
jgi:hypothetical protein